MEHVTDSAYVVAIVALSIIVAPTISGWLRLPGIIGFVIAGALVGPYVLSLVGEGALDGLGAIGLLYLMFQAGLEIDLRTFAKQRTAAIGFGLLTFALPLAFGAAEGALWLGFAPLAALLIGSIWASHTLVTLPEVRDAGIPTNRAVTTVAGATVLTDTLALLILAVVAAVAGGGEPSVVVVRLAVGLVLVAAWTMWALPRLGERFFIGRGQERVLRFAWLVFGLSSAAVLAEVFGIEGLVGAFLAGLGLNRIVPNEGPLMERVDFFGAALLVPAFLIYVGTKIDPSVVFQLATVKLAGLFLLALFLGKGAAALIGGGVLRFSWAEIGVMFGMSVPQAAATLAATLVGFDVGLFDIAVVNAVVLVVVVSILTGSLATGFFARRVRMPTSETRTLGARVVVGVTPAHSVAGLMRVAAAIGRPDDGHVAPVAIATGAGKAVAEARELAERAADAGQAFGADSEGRVRRSTSAAHGMLEAVSEERATALVVQWETGDSLAARTFGSELDAIGRASTVPVVAGRFADEPFDRVVAVIEARDVSSARRNDSRVAIRVAQRLADVYHLPLAVLASDAESIADLELPSGTRTIVAARYDFTGREELLAPGAVVVASPTAARAAAAGAYTLHTDYPGVSLVLCAGPHRLRLARMRAPRTDVLGWALGPEGEAGSAS